MPVKREGKLNGIEAKLENAQKRGLILGGMLVAQRAQAKAHVDTGRMKRAIHHGMPRQVGRLVFEVRIGSNVEYHEEEEFREGSKHGTPHAHMRPALAESRKEVTELIAKNIVATFK